MTDDNRPIDAEARERALEELGLRCRCPPSLPRPGAVAEARAIEGDRAMRPRDPIEDAGGNEIGDVGAVSVEENHRRAVPAFNVVQSHAINVDDATDGRMRGV
jgi:hypothetical protein